jgi:UDP-N-acetylmuramate-alanine ligase
MLWSYYFGRLYLPGVHLVIVGNEAVQLNFMQAHSEGQFGPPSANIERFVSYARDLIELAQVDAILITCSTMNRSYKAVMQAVAGDGVPVIQIDQPMLEHAVRLGGRILVIATHGPTVTSTQALLVEIASQMGVEPVYTGITVEEAWNSLAAGDVARHNQIIAEAIKSTITRDNYSCVVLAQLSMSTFLFSYPEPEAIFGLPVLTSGQYGFECVRRLFLSSPSSSGSTAGE